jgi:hypothetical protein
VDLRIHLAKVSQWRIEQVVDLRMVIFVFVNRFILNLSASEAARSLLETPLSRSGGRRTTNAGTTMRGSMRIRVDSGPPREESIPFTVLIVGDPAPKQADIAEI